MAQFGDAIGRKQIRAFTTWTAVLNAHVLVTDAIADLPPSAIDCVAEIDNVDLIAAAQLDNTTIDTLRSIRVIGVNGMSD